MFKLLLLGLLAAALFSSNFVLNRAMSVGGGHWIWSASLRYAETALLLAGWLRLRRGGGYLAGVLRLFVRRWGTWVLSGGIGYGVFYACLCFAADHAPAWITASTYQITILMTPLVLRAFGKRVPVRGIAFLVLIFLGIVVINADRVFSGLSVAQALAGVIPATVAAIAYPVGNQALNEARYASGDESPYLKDAFTCVLLLTLGSLPVFAVLVVTTMPPPPTLQQVVATTVIAVLAGCCATTLFIYARNLSSDPYRIAMVDATQAGEAVFTLIGEMLILGAALPDLPGWIGFATVVTGLLGMSLRSRA
jgi:drug/metabolite transporter (DMT)-like permease